MRIAIQGENGSFSHEAALQFEANATVLPCMLSADAFHQLEAGGTDALALPIENTLAGSVVEHFDLLYARDVRIVAETILPIRHNLIGLPGSTVESIRRVYSHPVALAQCRRFFADHPRIEPVPFYDTAGAVKQLVKLRDRHSGAIAGDRAALVHKGRILLAGIEDDPANFTRFVLVFPGAAGTPAFPGKAGPASAPDTVEGGASDLPVSPESAYPAEYSGKYPGDLSGTQKVSFGFQVEDAPGRLAAALTAAAGAGANLTKIQSRPILGQPWSYTFFFDAVVQSPQAADALVERLRAACLRVKELGRYRPAL
ncbi:MAG: prephenate dehydratase [Acidobacteriaceae bacterium]